MTELSGKSAGVSGRIIDLSGPRNVLPSGIPAGVIGTSNRGPAFVPVTVAVIEDFVVKFGDSDGTKFGPLAVSEWLKNARAATFLRVLGVGKGLKRETSGNNAGRVDSAGFVVGQELPLENGNLGGNVYANSNGPLGRTHLLGCFMSESAGSTVFSEAGIQTSGQNIAAPIVRGIIFAPSGVVPMLDVGAGGVTAGALNVAATAAGPSGAITGTVDLASGKQDFTMLLNGHKGSDPSFPNIISASFDQTSPNYFGNVFNTNPLNIEKAGHYLYSRYDIHPTQAVVTGVGIITGSTSQQNIAILTTGSVARNLGTSTTPNYENFEDRYTTPVSPSIISQKFGGSHKNLFKVFALSDGENANFKISIQNVAKSTIDDSNYGTFDLLVRDINDNDENQIVLERYSGLTLDPSSDNYIARKIGDLNTYFDWDKNETGQKLVVEGKFPNASNLIRVEMDSSVDDAEIHPTALPIGFRGYPHLVTSGSDPVTSIDADTTYLNSDGQDAIKKLVEPPVPFRENIATGLAPKETANKQLFWGVQFEQKTSLAEPNKSKVSNKTINTLSKYLPNFHTSFRNVSVGENAGVADSNGTVLDSDRFNNNVFSLDRIQIRTGSNGLLDAKEIVSMSYIREGNIVANEANKTRALSVNLDFGDLSTRNLAKFSFFIQGGFDGVNIFNNDTLEINNTAINEEMGDVDRGQDEGPSVMAYKKAVNIMSNVSDVDIKVLAIPGIRHEVITDRALDAVENDRFDCIYISDVEERDTLNQVVTSSVQNIDVGNTSTAFSNRGIDSNFGAAYFPDVIVENPFNSLNAQVPPSVAVLGALSLNDKVGFPWSAPAGFARGALDSTLRPAVALSRNNLDTLQDVNINPLVAFPGTNGTVVWGQKTLQQAQTALDRVNVRRLMIEIRRRVKSVANTILFEPNREATLEDFRKKVNPILKRIQDQQGISKFGIRIDTTTTTEADVLNNTIRGKIFVVPTRSAEVVSIDFVVKNPGAGA